MTTTLKSFADHQAPNILPPVPTIGKASLFRVIWPVFWKEFMIKMINSKTVNEELTPNFLLLLTSSSSQRESSVMPNIITPFSPYNLFAEEKEQETENLTESPDNWLSVD